MQSVFAINGDSLGHSLVSKLNGECTVDRQLPIPSYIGISPGEPLDEGIEIMRQRVHLSKESKPRLERLLGGLLRVEAENLIGGRRWNRA